MGIKSAKEWAENLNMLTRDKAAQYNIDLHSAACDIIDWSVLDTAFAGISIETNTQDWFDREYGEYLSKDGNWIVSWDKSNLTWHGKDVLPYNGWAE